MKLTTELKNVLASKYVDAFNTKLEAKRNAFIKNPVLNKLMKERDSLTAKRRKIDSMMQDLRVNETKTSNKIRKLLEGTGLIYDEPNASYSDSYVGKIHYRAANCNDIKNRYYCYNNFLSAYDEMLVTIQTEELGTDALKNIQKLIENALKNM